ncbi:flagellar biosynthetic protein FliO [Agarivorans sp. 1_MG-2023]|uniref:flagellar biosynthetic protein FliO n=1 Tax=Agarivorans sp. 1_MG-2023 TaxID=3062634 RepID=UPI0026E27BE5|nr:flagellar biosynthetic protein FliO [Agarivorans sp. 1_MG-2023]MDO6764749.1 flagellar biosynthetic protein FliO [Agarivorans sp. 1_MG-2023]
MRGSFGLLLILSIALPAAAEQEINAAPSSQVELLSWIMSLAVVLVTILVCAWVLKKTRLNQFAGDQSKVITNLALGTRERIMVVEIGEQQYLLGVTAQSINLLDKLEQPLEAKPNKMSGHFAKQLQGILSKNEK